MRRAGSWMAVGMLTASFVLLAGSAAQAATDDNGCETTPPTPLTTAIIAPVPAITGDEVAVQVLTFGRSREPDASEVRLGLSQPLPREVTALTVFVAQFKRQDGRNLRRAYLRADARLTERRDGLVLRVCVDPVVDGRALSAGEYTGTVALDDPRVAAAAATFRVQLQYVPAAGPMAVAVLGWLLGLAGAVTTATGLSFAWHYVRDHLPRLLFSAAAAASAAITVSLAQYWRDPVWTGEPELFVTYLVTTVGAAYAAANASGSLFVKEAAPGTPTPS
ncbi:MAG: hypothetical protein JWM64_52 [Frankiales bacterium]|nr:hypothetical protein [Frankiales bacterium]